MPIDPSIALRFRPPEIESPLNAAARFAQIQGAQTQNMLAQQQLEAGRRAQESENAFNIAYQQALNPETGQVDYSKLRTGVVQAGLGTKLPALEKQLAEQEESRAKVRKADTDLIDAKLKQSREFLSTVRTPEQYLAWSDANLKDPILGPMLSKYGSADATRANLQSALQTPGGFEDLLRRSSLGVEKFAEMNKPHFTTQDTGGKLRVITTPGLGGTATVVPGSEITKTMAPGEAQRIRLEGQRIGLEGRRVALAEENARREADPDFQQRVASARARGAAAAKDDIKAQQALPEIVESAQMGIDLIDQMVGKQEVRDKNGKVVQPGTKPHPGFQNAVGTTWLPGIRFVPGTDAAGFNALFDQVKGGAFLEAFESLKGGGAISEKEGEKATSAITRMSLAQDEKEFTAAAREFQGIVRRGAERAKQRAGAASSGGGVDMNNPLLK